MGDGQLTYEFKKTTGEYPNPVLAVGSVLTCEGTLPPIAITQSEIVTIHEDTVRILGTGTTTSATIEDEATFQVESIKAPVPKTKLEKGALTAIGEAADCSADANAKDPNLCGIVSGTPARPVLLGINVETAITFRVTNVGDEPLLDPTVEDETVAGDYKVKNIVCE